MKKYIVFSLSVDQKLAERINSFVEQIKDPYGKRNRAYALRCLIEAGLKECEDWLRNETKASQ